MGTSRILGNRNCLDWDRSGESGAYFPCSSKFWDAPVKIAAMHETRQQIIEALKQAGINASVIGKVQAKEKGRWLISETGSRPLPTFDRDEITRLFE